MRYEDSAFGSIVIIIIIIIIGGLGTTGAGVGCVPPHLFNLASLITFNKLTFAFKLSSIPPISNPFLYCCR